MLKSILVILNKLFETNVCKIGIWFFDLENGVRWNLRVQQVTMAILVEALAIIVIGRSYLQGCGFDSHCRPGSFLRINSWPVMYGAVGSLASSGVLSPSIWVQFPLEPLDLIV